MPNRTPGRRTTPVLRLAHKIQHTRLIPSARMVSHSPPQHRTGGSTSGLVLNCISDSLVASSELDLLLMEMQASGMHDIRGQLDLPRAYLNDPDPLQTRIHHDKINVLRVRGSVAVLHTCHLE